MLSFAVSTTRPMRRTLGVAGQRSRHRKDSQDSQFKPRRAVRNLAKPSRSLTVGAVRKLPVLRVKTGGFQLYITPEVEHGRAFRMFQGCKETPRKAPVFTQRQRSRCQLREHPGLFGMVCAFCFS
jgi:hypothetical protein